VQGVSRDKNALGYFGYAYYDANKSKVNAVSVNGVMPSRKTVENGKYQPLARPIFIYVNSKAAQRPEVKQFVEYYLTNGAKAAQSVKYVPLPAKAYKTALSHFKKPKLGTVFVGKSDVGITIDELLQMEAK
jgi:phosphate transport system substrate-binding protein